MATTDNPSGYWYVEVTIPIGEHNFPFDDAGPAFDTLTVASRFAKIIRAEHPDLGARVFVRDENGEQEYIHG